MPTHNATRSQVKLGATLHNNLCSPLKLPRKLALSHSIENDCCLHLWYA